MHVRFLLIFAALCLIFTVKAEAFVIINEILADPASSLAGDSNGDGVSSSTQDEFVEIYNNDTQSVNISGWKISDAISVRHVFANNTILNPHQFFVVFGGGSPLLSVPFQVASTGTLSLNNTSETVSLLDVNNLLIDQVVYGSLANQDQSIVRQVEGTNSSFILHTQQNGAAGKLFSPGTLASGNLPTDSSITIIPQVPTSAVPELPTGILMSFSTMVLGFLKRVR